MAFGLLLSGCRPDSAQSAPPAPTPAPALTTPKALVPEDTTTIVAPSAKTDPKSATITVYSVDAKGDGTKLLARQIPASDPAAPPEKRAVQAISQMASGKDSPLPKGTKVISVKFGGELATIDLSKEFKDNFSGGSTQEALTIDSVTATLGQFSGVKKVQFLVEGKKIDALGGGQELTDPIPVTAASPKE